VHTPSVVVVKLPVRSPRVRGRGAVRASAAGVCLWQTRVACRAHAELSLACRRAQASSDGSCVRLTGRATRTRTALLLSLPGAHRRRPPALSLVVQGGSPAWRARLLLAPRSAVPAWPPVNRRSAPNERGDIEDRAERRVRATKAAADDPAAAALGKVQMRLPAAVELDLPALWIVNRIRCGIALVPRGGAFE
jgi:hypothetical protein